MTAITRRRSYQRKHPRGEMLTPNGTVHNYYVEVSLAGQVNLETGLFLNIREIDGLIDQAWAALPAATESAPQLAEFLFERLQGPAREHGTELRKLRLSESADFWVDVWP